MKKYISKSAKKYHQLKLIAEKHNKHKGKGVWLKNVWIKIYDFLVWIYCMNT